uniref:Uncharacterized protein n=1 Tax=Plectus sambesii TaxID=2011161 RepID=A0A914WMM7_9BILA
MGAMPSHSAAPLPGYLALTFQSPDKIIILDPGAQHLASIQEIVTAKWTRGVQQQKWNNGAFEMKLRGRPFLAPLVSLNISASSMVAEARLFFCELIAELGRLQWTILLSSHFGKNTNCITWFLKQEDEQVMPGPTICLGLKSNDRLQLIAAHPAIESIVTETVASSLQETFTLASGMEVKLQGTPWSPRNFEEAAEARRILLTLIRKFSKMGYELRCTAAIRGYARIDSWMFHKKSQQSSTEAPAFCLMSLDMKNRIRMLEFSRALIETVESAVANNWLKGLQEKRPHYLGLAELKLSGNPWFSDGEDGIAGRRLFAAILQSLLAAGWTVSGVMSLSDRRNDKAAFVLRQCQTIKAPFICVCPGKYDLIRVIDGPPEVLKLVGSVIASHWAKGIQSEGDSAKGCREWKLAGNPWSMYDGNSADVIAGRLLLLKLLSELAELGWRVMCSADTSSRIIQDDDGYNVSEDGDTWFLARISCAL